MKDTHRKQVDKKRWKYTDNDTMLRSYLDDALQMLYWIIWLLVIITVCTVGCFFRLLFI